MCFPFCKPPPNYNSTPFVGKFSVEGPIRQVLFRKVYRYWFFPEQFTVGFSLLVLLALAAPPNLVRRLSALCPPCLPALCPPLVRLVLLALAAPPVLVRLVSAARPPLVPALCPPCGWLCMAPPPSPCPPLVSALCCWLWLRLHALSAACPPCVLSAASPELFRHVSALCPPCVVLVRHLSALCCWLWPRLHRLVLLAAPPTLLFGTLQSLSARCPPCVPLVLLAFVRHVCF